jgi:hypothetical protein
LKKEFDNHRARGSRHPLLERYGVDAVPVNHSMLPAWRKNLWESSTTISRRT